MERNLEVQLNELMMKNQKKFSELIEKASNNFREKFNKELYIKNRERTRILDGSNSSDYFTSLEVVEDWIDKCIDEIRNYLKPFSYPLFVYLYIDLILKDFWTEAKLFFEKFSSKYVSFSEELQQLQNLKAPLNMNTPILSNYLKNKVHIYVPRTIMDFFAHFLNTNNLILVFDILNKFFERSTLLSKLGTTESISGTDKFVLLNLSGEELERINGKTSIYYNKIKKDQDILIKKGRGRGDKNALSKVIVPVPENYLEYMPIETPNLKIDKSNPPTIGCFTILNSHNKLNCADVTNDGSIIACGFKDGTITVWITDKDLKIDIDENVLKSMEEYKDTNISKLSSKKIEGDDIHRILKEAQKSENDEKENFDSAYDIWVKTQRKFYLYGHSESIFSVSLSPDKRFLISGSYDESIRLWSLHTKSTIVLYKGHFSPVMSVKFSPFSHYFASGGCDKTARLWTVNSPGPVRIFAGHLSDVEFVDFHPNSLYLVTSANDKTIRLWSLESGECVRIFFNFSDTTFTDSICFSGSGKIMAVACDKSLILYDLIKMGDPIRIVKNFTSKSITALSFDNEDNVLSVSTEDYKITFFNLQSILNDDLSLKVDNLAETKNKIEIICQYSTKKTTVLVSKFTLNNIFLTLGRFDDNDPKIFM